MGSLETHARLIDQLFSLGPLVGGLMKGVVEAEGLTESQANLLWLIAPDVPPLPMKQLATRLQCDPSNVTLLTAQIEKLGLARRVPHPEDGRVRTLVLTPAGRKVRKRLLANAHARSPFSALDDGEQLQLYKLLAKTLSR